MNNKKEEAIDKYADTLYKLAFLRLKNKEDAEDVVQEVFYKYIGFFFAHSTTGK